MTQSPDNREPPELPTGPPLPGAEPGPGDGDIPLHRLLAGRYLSARWADAPAHRGPGRKRKYYAITAKGRRELAKRTVEWQEFSTAVNAILLGG